MPTDRALARSLREAEDAGREEAALYRREPERLADSRLGSFDQQPPALAARLRLALRLRVPLRALAAADEELARMYAFWDGARRELPPEDWHRLTNGPTILMYHAFGSPASRFVVPAARFERQLRLLHRLRRPVVSLDDLAACREKQALPPAGAVAVTIDDAYRDVRRVAVPLLRAQAVPATVFVVTGKVGTANDWDEGELGGRALLSWVELEELAQLGVSLGAHTRSHPQLPRLEAEHARVEISGSRDDLRDRLGTAPIAFAYPHGRVDDATETLAKAAGFAVACGVARGRNSAATSPHRLRRFEVDGRLSLAGFARLLVLGA